MRLYTVGPTVEYNGDTLVVPYPYCMDHEDSVENDIFYMWCRKQKIKAIYGNHLSFKTEEDRMLFIMSMT